MTTERPQTEAPAALEDYPLDRTAERELDPRYQGPVVVCDIDKTYLATNFESLKGLLAIPFELAVDKRAIPGMGALLREVRRGPGSRSRLTPLYFVSASPPQLRRILQKKMLLDGVEYDGVTFKDQLRILRHGEVGRLREHLSFKLTALLLYHTELPAGAREILIGDDTESDALCYTIFGDAVAGRLRGDALAALLVRRGVGPADAAAITARVDALAPRDSVEHIYIHLEKRTPPEDLLGFARLTATRNALQLALDLWGRQHLGLAAVPRVAAALRQTGVQLAELVATVLDARARGLVDGAGAAAAAAALAEAGLWPAGLTLAPAEEKRPREPEREEREQRGPLVPPALTAG
ncbi:MAG TPA: phosphatase domain-containing protein [Polyangia bacterium]